MASRVKAMTVRDLGVMGYREAYAEQLATLERVVSARGTPGATLGEILLVEHPAVITMSRKAREGAHLLATPELLAARGVALEETDRGGDITYHGPGQLVAYPIVDLNEAGLGLHEHMRSLEEAVIRVCARVGVRAGRDPGATGVWVDPAEEPRAKAVGLHAAAKLCAFGVRVKRWVSMHGLAINVRTRLEDFALIVPCGLAGRPVTSLEQLLGPKTPEMAEMKAMLVEALREVYEAAADRQAARGGGSTQV